MAAATPAPPPATAGGCQHTPQMHRSTVRLLEASARAAATELLGLGAAGVRHQQGAVICEQCLLDLEQLGDSGGQDVAQGRPLAVAIGPAHYPYNPLQDSL